MSMQYIPNWDRQLKYKYAEEWLDNAVAELRKYFSNFGFHIPEVLVSCGHGVEGYKPSKKSNNLGFCMKKCYSKDGLNIIYISPIIETPEEIIYTLAHELIHAIDDCFSMHGETFKDIARTVGFYERGICGVSEERFKNCLKSFADIANGLGRYPRSGVNYKETFCVENDEYQIQLLAEMERKMTRMKINKMKRSH